MSFQQGDISLRLTIGRARYRLGEPWTIDVRVEMKRPVDLAGAYVRFEADNYFQSSLEYFKPAQSSVTMTLSPFHGRTYDHPKSNLDLTLYNSARQSLVSDSWALSFSRWTGDFFQPIRNGEERNVLVFGLAGSTKSSFINSCYTLLDSDSSRITCKATSGGNAIRVTVELRPYRLTDTQQNQEQSIVRVWDTWGIEQDDGSNAATAYDRGEFDLIIQGRAGRFWSIGQPVAVSDIAVQPVVEGCAQHACIFFIPVAELQNPSGSMVAKTRKFIEDCTRLKVSSVIALTKMDMPCPDFRTNGKITDEIQGYIRTAASLFAVAENDVYPLVNYFTEHTKSFEVDRTACKLLAKALAHAQPAPTIGIDPTAW